MRKTITLALIGQRTDLAFATSQAKSDTLRQDAFGEAHITIESTRLTRALGAIISQKE